MPLDPPCKVTSYPGSFEKLAGDERMLGGRLLSQRHMTARTMGADRKSFLFPSVPRSLMGGIEKPR